MNIAKEELDEYYKRRRSIREVVIELGEYYMVINDLDPSSLVVQVKDNENGFDIVYRDDDEVRDSFNFGVYELVDTELIRKAIRAKRENWLLQQDKSQDIFYREEERKERLELARLKEKYKDK